MARPIRIARPPATGGSSSSAPTARQRARRPSLERGLPVRKWSRDDPSWDSNSEAFRRSWLFFGLAFLLSPLAIWALFVWVALTSPYSGVSSDETGLVLLSGLLGATVVVGAALTVLRTPRAIRMGGRSALEVVNPWGRVDRYHLSGDAYQRPLETYPAGFLGRVTCELVELHAPPGPNRRWIVEEGRLDPYVPRVAGRRRLRGPGGSRPGSVAPEEDPGKDLPTPAGPRVPRRPG